MNLFIGLLNIAIEKDNNRVSYLIQKAEVYNFNINNSIFVNKYITYYCFYRFWLRLSYFIYYHIRDVGKHGFLKLCM
jgi:hypothetical protein